MQLIYQGKDIAPSVDIRHAEIVDNAGGVADSVELCFNDPQDVWSQWKPQKDDQVQLKKDGFNSGVMYVDELEQRRGVFIVRALSLPQEAKTERSQGWEQVRLLEIADELASRYGLRLEHYGLTNHLYERVDQREQADFAFLASRCALEGYSLKITDGRVVIFSERDMEAAPSSLTIAREDLDGEFTFWTRSTGIYGAASVRYGTVGYEYRVGPGPTFRVNDLYVSDQATAERFSRGLLRSKNKHEHTGFCTIRLAPGLAAGNIAAVTDMGMADGLYYCEQVRHNLVADRTHLRLRRPLEGY